MKRFVLVSLALASLAPWCRADEPTPDSIAADSARFATWSALDDEGRAAITGVLKEGRGWTAEQAAAAGVRLKATPTDLADRLRLIGLRAPDERSTAAYQALVLGLVANHATQPIGGAVAMMLQASGASKDTWHLLELAWDAQVTAHPTEAGILANGGVFLDGYHDDEERNTRGMELLAKAHERDPAQWRWTVILAKQHARVLYMNEGVGEAGKAAGIETLKLLRVLEATLPKGTAIDVMPCWDIPEGAAHAALAAGDLAEAKRRAEAVLRAVERENDDWNNGNAVHDMHQILGAAALQSRDVADAKRHLLAAGRTTGSPQLNSFGPDFKLARDLLAKGERATVVEYLDLCGKFWGSGGGQLADWKKTIAVGGTPDFGLPAVTRGPTKTTRPAPERFASAEKPAGLVGLWESASKSYGGIGGAIEFRADGTVLTAMVVIVDMHWQTEGKELVLTAPGEPDVRMPLGTIEGDNWTITIEGVEMKKARVASGGTGSAAIVGTWSFGHDIGTRTNERYEANGNASLRIPMAGGERGTYTSKAASVHMSFAGKPADDNEFTIKDDRLSLTNAEGKTHEYRFVGAKPWYDLERKP